MLAFKKVATTLLITMLLGMFGATLQASTSGKIAGVVVDAVTGEPLRGANISVFGTKNVTEADLDGEFYIINLPVGTHDLVVSLMGYETVNVESVRVLMDLTTPLEVAMVRSPIDMGKTVTVVAKRPKIQRDLTASRTILTQDDIIYMADTRSIQGILSNMAGTVVGSDGFLHVRGGRQGSVNYYYDGFFVQDPFSGEVGMRINPDALEELSLTSGGLSPEYGGTLSGVVNSITREGGRDFKARLKYYEGATDRYNVTTGEYDGMSLVDNRSVLLNMSGPLFNIADRASTFFTSIETNKANTYLPHNAGHQFTGTGKFVFFPSTQSKVTVNSAYYKEDRQRYMHSDVNGISYDFNLDGLGKWEKEAYLVGLKTEYNKSASTVIAFQVNRYKTDFKQAPEQLFDKYWTEWPGYSVNEDGVYNGTIDDSNYNASPDYNYIGFTSGNDYWPYYLKESSEYYGGNFSILSQFNKVNQVKIGADLRKYKLMHDNRQFYNDLPYGETYNAHPWVGAAYAMDKIELNDLVVNLGFRFDYFYSDVQYWQDPVEKTTRVDSKAKHQFSPRLGISHPVSVNSVLHFNYGYLFQPPNTDLLYTNLQADFNTGFPILGNPDLQAEKTIYYELGWTQVLNDEMRLNLTTYYRDIENLVGARQSLDAKGNQYTFYDNADYGSVKGFDVEYVSLNRKFFNWSISYSYMIARGNASNPNEYYYNYFNGDSLIDLPRREYPLSYDQRHNLTAVFDFRVPRNENFRFMGQSMPTAWGVNLLAKYGSGLPYTRIGKDNTRGPINGERMPSTLRFDMRFNKDFFLDKSAQTHLTFFFEVENLFDRRNVVNVYSATGQPDRSQLASGETDQSEQEKYWDMLMDHDPQNYTPPRMLRIGMEINF